MHGLLATNASVFAPSPVITSPSIGASAVSTRRAKIAADSALRLSREHLLHLEISTPLLASIPGFPYHQYLIWHHASVPLADEAHVRSIAVTTSMQCLPVSHPQISCELPHNERAEAKILVEASLRHRSSPMLCRCKKKSRDHTFIQAGMSQVTRQLYGHGSCAVMPSSARPSLVDLVDLVSSPRQYRQTTSTGSTESKPSPWREDHLREKPPAPERMHKIDRSSITEMSAIRSSS